MTALSHLSFFPRWMVFCSLSAVMACSEPEGCDLCTTSAIVYGRVLHDNGSPLIGNAVFIEVHPESCDSALILGASDAGLVTGADGSYRTQVIAGAAPFTGCPRVRVELPGGSPDHLSVDGASVAFRDDFGTTEPRDSVQVDIEVP